MTVRADPATLDQDAMPGLPHRLTVKRNGDVLTIVLDRPDKHNAMDQAAYLAFAEALENTVGSDVRAIVIAAEGRTFCAGNDMDHFRTRWPQGPHDEVVRFLLALSRVEIPIVAAIQGAAVGIGATMLLHCDLIVAAPEAYLRYPFLQLGLAPEGGSSRLLRERVGPHRAMEMLLSGRAVPADEALALGLVTHLVPANDLRTQASVLAANIAALAPLSVRTARARLFAPGIDIEALIHAEIEDVNATLAAAGT